MATKTTIVDGRNLLWRNADTHRGLTVEVDGYPVRTGAMYGFLLSLYKIANTNKGRVIICWEGDNEYRKTIYADYKRKTQKLDPDYRRLLEAVNAQESTLKHILSLLGIPQFYAPKWEADDCIGVLSVTLDTPVIIYSGDNDLLQLLRKGVTATQPKRGGKLNVVTTKTFRKQYGLKPKRLIDIKALAGDTSDNYPGVPGIGEIWAIKLIQEYGNVKRVLKAAKTGSLTGTDDNGKKWKTDAKAKTITDNRDMVRLCYDLATIRTDVEIIEIPSKTRRKAVEAVFIKLRFRSLLRNKILTPLLNAGKA